MGWGPSSTVPVKCVLTVTEAMGDLASLESTVEPKRVSIGVKAIESTQRMRG